MIGIVVSRADSASEHIGEQLRTVEDWTVRTDETRSDGDGGGRYLRTEGFSLREFDDLHIHLEHAAEAFEEPEFLVFASRHSGETGPLLTAHFTGNFGPAEFGGSDNELARACPNAHKKVVAALERNAPDAYEVGIEGTHHGPTDVGAPSMFVELGSDEEQWADPEAAQAIARSILTLRNVSVDRADESPKRQLVGFNGGHYAPRFTRIVRETDWAVGHIASDWTLDAMGAPAENRDVVRAAFEQSAAEYAVVDGDRPGLESVIDELGYRVVSETWVQAVEGVPVSFAEAVEDALRPVDDGLRFGSPATDYRGEFVVLDLPDELLADALGIDAGATRDAVAERLLAFETAENGNRISGRGAGASAADRDHLVRALVDILRTEYDSVERTTDSVVVTETTFDPKRARSLGVPEGPEFGALSSGDTVTVNGTTIRPEQVQSEKTRRFPL